MEISISGRHFSVNDELKTRITNHITSALEGKSIKIISAKVVLEVEHETRATAELVLNAKDQVFASTNTDRELKKAFMTSLDKVVIQVDKYLDKKQDHRG